MYKILIIGHLHHKNKQGLIKILDHLNIHHQFVSGLTSDLTSQYNIIYSPSQPINISLYPNNLFIFGPHFSVFPDNNQLASIQDIINSSNSSDSSNILYNRCVYIQPSEQTVNLWKKYNANKYLSLKSFPFPVDTEIFAPSRNILDTNKTNIFIYYKRRHPIELNYIKTQIEDNNYKNQYRVFDYVQRYDENDYLNYIRTCKFGIILDAHESQGFAIQEALSCNIPLLVWSTRTMGQEYCNNYTYPNNTDILSTVPYWDYRCGEIFYNLDDYINTYNIFIDNIEKNIYKPREYILETLSLQPCAERFINLLHSIQPSNLSTDK